MREKGPMIGELRWLPVSAIAVAACCTALQASGQTQGVPVVLPSQAARAQPRPTAATPVTDRECEAFGRQLENRFAEGDKTLFGRSLDFEGMLHRFTNSDVQSASGMPKPDSSATPAPASASPPKKSPPRPDAFRATAPPTPGASSFRLLRTVDRGEFNQELVTVVNARISQMQTLKYIRFRRTNAEPCLVLRLMPRSGGCSFLELVLGRDSSGRLRIRDWFNYTTGESLTQTMGRLGLYPFLTKQKDLELRLFGDEPEYIKFLNRKELAKALQGVERMDEAIGGDAYLDYQRAEILFKLGQETKATEAANLAMEREPDLTEPYFLMMGRLVHARQNVAAIALLDRLRAASNLPREELAKIVEAEKGYARLIGSAEYRNWRAGAAVGLAAAAPASPQPGRANAGSTAKPGLKLQAIFYKPVGAGATISGQYLEVGEKIQGHKVLAIAQQSVTLQAPDGAKKVFTLGDSAR